MRVVVVLLRGVWGRGSPAGTGNQDTTPITVTFITVTITSITFIITPPVHVVNAQLGALLFVHAPCYRTAGIWQRYEFPCHSIMLSQQPFNVRFGCHLRPGALTCKAMWFQKSEREKPHCGETQIYVRPTSRRVNNVNSVNAATTLAVETSCKTSSVHGMKVYQASVGSRHVQRSQAFHFQVSGWCAGV